MQKERSENDIARYIDATEITDQIAKFKKAVNSYGDYMKGYFNALTAVEVMIVNIRTADVVKVRHGMWMHEDEYDDEYICSICGQLAPLSISQIHEHTTKYCPWCGAKMDGERKEE